MEAWAKVAISPEFIGTLHGGIPCTDCHGGVDGVTDMAAAHAGVVTDPDPDAACASCHSEETEHHVGSLHATLGGYTEALAARSTEEAWPAIMTAYDNHCASCHASCGQCHVSRPTSTGGGLLEGHTFKATPPMNLTCTGCHGSRVNDEYKGNNEMADGGTYPADVHYNPGGMACGDCHSASEMHGAIEGDPANRYDGDPLPDCEDCHEGVGGGEDENPQHSEGHLEDLACQVCHSVDYKQCYSCHVQTSEDGVPFFRTEESEMAFAIGYNPIRSDERPWKYVVLRHVPIDRESFAFYGDDLLSNFDALPTWVYATPHNIQRHTPQNESCLSCHGSDEYFLTEDRVLPGELEANRDVIVPGAPPFP